MIAILWLTLALAVLYSGMYVVDSWPASWAARGYSWCCLAWFGGVVCTYLTLAQ